MANYSEITAYFKKTQQAQNKLDIAEKNKKILQSLVDLSEMQKIQTTVEERMGPYMCDNTQKQSNAERDAFLAVLQDFKKESRKSTKLINQRFNKIKEGFSEKKQAIEQHFQAAQNKWQKQRSKLKKLSNGLAKCQKAKQLRQSVNRMDENLQHAMRQMQSQLQILMLQQRIRGRKSWNQLVQLVNF